MEAPGGGGGDGEIDSNNAKKTGGGGGGGGGGSSPHVIVPPVAAEAAPPPAAAAGRPAMAALQAADAILRPDVLDRIKAYLQQERGTPQEAVKMLSENYRGYSSMAQLVCSWLRELNFHDFSEEDLLRELVKRHFSVAKVDQIFETGHIPEWLKSLLNDHSGRLLVYELFETHRNCVLLNFAVQKIWKDGHTAEVASVSSASAIFTVFQPVAEARIASFLAASDADFEQTFQPVCQIALYSQYTFVYILGLLAAIGAEENDNPLAWRAIGELEVCGGAAYGDFVHRLVPLVCPPNTLQREVVECSAFIISKYIPCLSEFMPTNDATRIRRGLCNAVDKVGEIGPDIKRLRRLLDRSTADQDAADEDELFRTIWQLRKQLRRRALMELLLSIAMTPSSATFSEFIDSAQTALSFAVVDVERPKPGTDFSSFAGDFQHEIGNCVRELESVRQDLEGSIQGRPLDDSFCSQKLGSSRLLCSAAVVFLSRILEAGSLVTSVHFRTGFRDMIDVIRHVAIAAPDIYWRCLVAFKAGLTAVSPTSGDDVGSGGGSVSQIAASLHEAKLALLSEAVRLLATLSGASAATATLAMVYQWARGDEGGNVDVSLVRHFVVATAHVITGPFSLEFLGQFLFLVETGALGKFLPQLAKEQRNALHLFGVDAISTLKSAIDEGGAAHGDEKMELAELQRLQDLARTLIIDNDADTASE